MMVVGKFREFIMEVRREAMAFIIGVTLVLMTALCCATFYQYNQTLAIKSNIESAIVKGIDPLSVRCAYGDNSHTCVAYAVSHGQSTERKSK
jgi:hypothetical protein